MSLEKKYGIPEATVKQMVCDGVISCSVARHYEIYGRFQQIESQSQGRSTFDIILQVADELKVNDSTVQKIVYSFRKKT
jgi:hypothetical protein